jgi:hypothetical protein
LREQRIAAQVFGIKPYSMSWRVMRSMFALSLSILLTATTIDTPASWRG